MAEPNATLADPAALDAATSERPFESRPKSLWPDIKFAGSMFGRYLKADPAMGILLLAIILGGGSAASVIFLQIQLNLAAITNALVARDGSIVSQLIPSLLLTALGMALIGVASIWARLTFRMRFRRVITERLVTRWMAGNRFYHSERGARLDYPEQRIQEDIYLFIERVAMTGPLVLFSMLGIVLYSSQLWRLSPPLTIPSVGINEPITGFLVFVAFGFGILWTFLIHFVGRSLTRAEVVRHRLEAQFRQEMAAVRENGESIAFAKAGNIEHRRLAGTFNLIRKNWDFFTFSTMKITVVAGIPESFLAVAPTIICAPFVLSGQMQIGDIALVAVSFLQVYNGVGVLITQYAELAVIRASAARLRFLDETLDQAVTSDIRVTEDVGGDIQVQGLTIAFPNGDVMTDVGNLAIPAGSRLLVQGKSGAGKSTLLRAIAGLWPYGRGNVMLPQGRATAFLPQRAYMPSGTLASLMAYPHPSTAYDDEMYISLLNKLGLQKFSERLHDYQPWSRILSPGEQQRIAAARAILAAPDFLFIDEGTSALDEASEATLYGLIGERLPRAAVVSVAHRPSVAKFHDTLLAIQDGKAIASRIETQSA